MKLTADWLQSPDTIAVMKALQTKNNQVFFVGGCVRNGLLGVPTTDIDISTDSRPEQIIALARTAGLKSIPTGIDHGTVTIVVNSNVFEVTCFRKDIETDGRHAIIAFANNIYDDAKRRDFTMNAIYALADGTIVDPLNGMTDLKNRHVRFIGNATKRIAEDYLRILRFFRFTAQYGDPALGIDADGLAACAAGVDGINLLPKERIGNEMRKILGSKNPSLVLATMDVSGILAKVLTGANAKYIAILVHLEQADQINWLTRLIVLGGSNQSAALRLTNAEARELRHTLKAIELGHKPNAIAFEFGKNIAVSTSLALAALTESAPPINLEAQITQGTSAIFPITAKDLDGLHGKQLGDTLRKLQKLWVASDFTLKKQDLLL